VTYSNGVLDAPALSDIINTSSLAFLDINTLKTIPTSIATAKADIAPFLTLKLNPITRQAQSSHTAEQVFTEFSTALSGTAYYVDRNLGNDSNPGTSGSPYLSIGKAIQVANAAGVPARIYVVGGYARGYGRGSGPNVGGAPRNDIAVDTAFIATGGIVDSGTWDDAGYSWTEDGTYKGLYTCTVSNVSKVIDRKRKTSTRVHENMEQLPSAEACRYQPGWFHTGTTLSLRRTDGAAPTTNNTRVLRPVAHFSCRADVNVGFFADTGSDGWSFSGGALGDKNDVSTNVGGGVSYRRLTVGEAAPADRKCLVIENAVFEHGYRGLEIEGLHGLIYLDRCGGAEALTDTFNFHCARTTVDYLGILVNCWARDTGVFPQTSNQCLTLHDADRCKAITVGCDFEGSRGGVVRNIEGSLWASYMDRFGPDRGDEFVATDGQVQPCGVFLNSTGTTAWLYEPVFESQVTDMRVLADSTAYVQSARSLRAGGAGTVAVWS
jgi:hypothetical protein